MNRVIDRDKLAYCPSYCEENIWHLCGALKDLFEVSYVILISNQQQQVALWQQKKSPAEDLPIVWDYHVILATIDSENENEKRAQLIWDFDSRCPFPCELSNYLSMTAPLLPAHLKNFSPLFRVIESSDYLQFFSSNRSHMQKDGKWMSPPPTWPCIGDGHNLGQFIDMNNQQHGKVFSLAQLKNFFQTEKEKSQ